MFTALYVELNVFCIVIVAMVYIWSSKSIEQSSQMSFNFSLIAIIFFILTDMLWHLMKWNFLPQIVPIALILKSIYFLSTTTMCYFWFTYYERFRESTLIMKHPSLIRNPYIIIMQIILTLFNFPFGFFFNYTDGFTYNRGSLFMLQYLFAYIYIIISILSAVYDFFKHNISANQGKNSGFAVFIIMSGISGFVQLFHQDFPMSCVCITGAVLFTYKSILNETVSIDSLTRLNNRKSIMSTLNYKMQRKRENYDVYVFMIDVDFFKKINDTYGHVEGDHALKTVADTLRSAAVGFQFRPAIGRYGGDEFIIVLEAHDYNEAQKLKNAILKNLEEKNKTIDKGYKLGLSIGIACQNGRNIDEKELISEADNELYKVKKARHRERV